jgi:hypothetical protein
MGGESAFGGGGLRADGGAVSAADVPLPALAELIGRAGLRHLVA